MDIKKQYEMNDVVWIHLGNGKLTKGKIVDIFDLAHAGYSKETEFYIVEIPTEIEALLEVRTWESISQDAKGPIGIYRDIKEKSFSTKKYLGKVGIELPTESLKEETSTTDELDILDPTPEQVNAALDRSIKSRDDTFISTLSKAPKKRIYRRKNERKPRPKTL